MREMSEGTTKQYSYAITHAKEEHRDYKALNTYDYIYERGARRIHSTNPRD